MRGIAQPWNEAQIEYLKNNYSKMSLAEVTEEINKLGEPHTSGSVKHFISKNRILSGRTGRFEKGRISHNKGMKMTPEQYARLAPTMFKKGGTPHNVLKIGAEAVVDQHGQKYIKVKVAEPNVWKYKHRLTWEQHNGPLKPGEAVIFLDGDYKNCDISNLRKVTQSELAIINNKGMIRTDDPQLKEVQIDYARLWNRLKKQDEKGGADNGD